MVCQRKHLGRKAWCCPIIINMLLATISALSMNIFLYKQCIALVLNYFQISIGRAKVNNLGLSLFLAMIRLTVSDITIVTSTSSMASRWSPHIYLLHQWIGTCSPTGLGIPLHCIRFQSNSRLSGGMSYLKLGYNRCIICSGILCHHLTLRICNRAGRILISCRNSHMFVSHL